MNTVLWRKVWRDLWRHRTRTILVVFSIAVGSFAIGLVGTVLQELMQSLNRSYLASNPPHGTVFAASDLGFDEQALQVVQNLDGIQIVEARSVLITRAKIGSQEWQDFVIFAVPDFEAGQLAKIEPIAGAWPPSAGTLLLERAAMEELHVTPGEVLTIHTSTGAEHQLRIVGSVHDPSRGSLAIGDPAAGYISLSTLNQLQPSSGFTEILIRVDEELPVGERVEEMLNRSSALLQKEGYAVDSTLPGKYKEHPFTDSIRTMTLVLTVLGIMALLMTSSLVVITMGSVLTQEVRQIGVLKTLGAHSSRIRSLYLRLVVAHGLVALLLSVPVTALAARALTSLLGRLFNTDILDFGIPPFVIVLQTLACLLLPILFTLRTVTIGTKATVREALSDYGLNPVTGRSWLTQILSALGKRMTVLNRLPLWLQFSLRNVLRRKRRALFTFITLLISGLLFESVLSLHASQMKRLDLNLAPFAYDVQIDLSQIGQTEVVNQTLRDRGEEVSVEGWTVVRAGLEGSEPNGQGRLRLTALPADTVMMEFTVVEGRWLQAGDQNAMVIDRFVQFDHPELVLNSEVTLDLGGQATVWRIVGIVERIQQPGAYVALTDYWRQTGAIGDINTIYLRSPADDAQAQLALAQTAEQDLEASGLAIRAVRTASEVRATEARGFYLIRAFLLSMILIVSLVGGLGLTGTLSINVVERTREIGILRAVGASRGVITKIIFAEAVMISLIAWLAATLLSIPASLLFLYLIEALTDEALPYTFPAASLLGWLGIMLFLAWLASLIPAYKATQIAVREALVYE